MKNNTQLAIAFSQSNQIQAVQPWNQVAEIEISYRNQVKPADRPKICTSQDAYQIIYHQFDPGTIGLFESFKVLLLNRANKVLGIIHLSQGGVSKWNSGRSQTGLFCSFERSCQFSDSFP